MRTFTIGLAVVLPMILSQGALAQSTAESADCVYDHDQSYRISTPLEVYTGPSSTRRIIYDLPANARTIRCVGPCKGDWCRVRWRGVVGWIMRRHLIPDGKVTWTTKPLP